MKKLFPILVVFLLFSCAWAQSSSIEINGVDFDIPNKYLGGDEISNGYRLDNTFSIRCIDEDVAGAIGLWAEEKEYSNDLNIGNHPVRHFCQYNEYVNGNHSHAYFMSGESVYEISWVGNEVTSDIEKLIKDTPASEIDDDAFYDMLDDSAYTYKQKKTDKLNMDAEYNYLEAKYSSQEPQSHDDTKFKEILLTRYNSH